MSKTAQRKRSAYDKGYRVGRWDEWDSPRGYRFDMASAREFERGRAAGRRDLRAAQRVANTWHRRLVAWLRRVLRA